MRERFEELGEYDPQSLFEKISKYNKGVIQNAYGIEGGGTPEQNLSPEIRTVLRKRRKKLQCLDDIWNQSDFREHRTADPICRTVEEGMSFALQKESVTSIRNPVVFLTSEEDFYRDRMNWYKHNKYPDHRSCQTMQAWYGFLLSQAILVDVAVLKNNPSESFSRNIGHPENGIIIDELFPRTVVRFEGLERAKENAQGYALPLVARRFRDKALVHKIEEYVKKEEGGNPISRLIERLFLNIHSR